jgi:hypothetical protein
MKKTMLIVALVLSLSGCKSATDPTPENYLKTINAYLPDHPDCLLDSNTTFPFETSDPVRTKQMDALVKNQVLEVGRDLSIHVSRYTLTPAGKAAGAHLCFGYRNATEVVSNTTPALANGFTETAVTYKYKLHDMPMWAKSADVQAVFPTLAHEASGDATDTITLALDRISWSVPN